MYQRIKSLLCHNKCIHENPCDIMTVEYEHDKTKYLKKCLQCGAISGTLGIITHYLNCKYKENNVVFPIVQGSLLPALVPFNHSSCLIVGQREYGVVGKSHAKPIIGSLWASSCVILCMRNRETTETILAHIDGLSVDPIAIFLSFPPDICDVFLIGGDYMSKNKVHQLLQTLEDYNYIITYCCIINETSKSFAINSIDGTTYSDYYLVSNVNLVNNTTNNVSFTMTPLTKIVR